ncbi:MAG: demethoxyubiquinone hydroxylase family protein [Alphaproteobacteria bacterium]|nr:MAG: demethoxyubiquinone hydroxylase family protein [Alphaproteobacteria bacterium]
MARQLNRKLPGDKGISGTARAEDRIARMIRVNHAGEYGARRIYQGQLKVLGKDPELRKTLEHMAAQEEEHLAYFEEAIVKRRVRPTALHPLWHAAGYALGYVTARIGPEAAMACTVAVEEVISDHYGDQLAALADTKDEADLRKHIAKFKAEEEEHHDIGLEHDAEQAPFYKLLTTAIKTGSKLAIAVAKRV